MHNLRRILTAINAKTQTSTRFIFLKKIGVAASELLTRMKFLSKYSVNVFFNSKNSFFDILYNGPQKTVGFVFPPTVRFRDIFFPDELVVIDWFHFYRKHLNNPNIVRGLSF